MNGKMKKYFTVAVLFYLSVVAQTSLAKPLTPPQLIEEVVNIINNTDLPMKKEQLSPELMQYEEFAGSDQETQYEVYSQHAEEYTPVHEEPGANIIKLLIAWLDPNTKQLYYGVSAAVINAAQFEILAHFIYRPLSLIHDPYSGNWPTLTSSLLYAVFEELWFRGCLLPGIALFMEDLMDSAEGSNERIFMAGNAIISVIFGFIHLLNQKPSKLRFFQSTLFSFVAGLLYRYSGLLGAVIYHATSNTIAYVLFVHRGYM